MSLWGLAAWSTQSKNLVQICRVTTSWPVCACSHHLMEGDEYGGFGLRMEGTTVCIEHYVSKAPVEVFQWAAGDIRIWSYWKLLPLLWLSHVMTFFFKSNHHLTRGIAAKSSIYDAVYVNVKCICHITWTVQKWNFQTASSHMHFRQICFSEAFR